MKRFPTVYYCNVIYKEINNAIYPPANPDDIHFEFFKNDRQSFYRDFCKSIPIVAEACPLFDLFVENNPEWYLYTETKNDKLD
jgi:hypothetical protein